MEPTLSDYVAVLRRRRLVVLLCVALAVGVALAVSLVQKPIYSVTSELILRQTPSEALLVDANGQSSAAMTVERRLNNEIEVVESGVIRELVAASYDGPLDVDSVRGQAPSSDSNDVLHITLEATDPRAATELVNLYADTYIEERRSRQRADLVATGETMEARLSELRVQIADVRRPLDDLDAQIAALPIDSAERMGLETRRDDLAATVQSQLTPLETLEASLLGQLEQLQVSQHITRDSGIAVLTPASEPNAPVSPNTPVNLVVGGLIGLLLGIAIAFVTEHADDSVRSREDLEEAIDLPVMGLIPKASDRESAGRVSFADASSAAAEAYRSLRTSVRFLGLQASVRTILVTSTAAAEGKTVTAANLATVLAQNGDRVLLVGADLRRPQLHEHLRVPETPGLSTVLIGEAQPSEAIFELPTTPGLHVMPSGLTPPSPAELLDSDGARDLFRQLAERYDAIVIDSPPVLPVADPQVLSRVADIVLLVVACGATSRRGLRRAIELLNRIDAPLVGAVLNMVPGSESYGGSPYRYDALANHQRLRHGKRASDEGAQESLNA